MKFLRAMIFLFACTFASLDASAQTSGGGGGPQPVGECCSPADVGAAPAAIACDEQCFVWSNETDRAIHCDLEGTTSGPWTAGGTCHDSDPGLTCSTTTCTASVLEFTCRKERCPGQTGKVYCYWDVSGVIPDFQYPACTGNDCWGGGPVAVPCPV